MSETSLETLVTSLDINVADWQYHVHTDLGAGHSVYLYYKDLVIDSFSDPGMSRETAHVLGKNMLQTALHGGYDVGLLLKGAHI